MLTDAWNSNCGTELFVLKLSFIQCKLWCNSRSTCSS